MSMNIFQTGRYPYHVGQQTGMNLNPTPGMSKHFRRKISNLCHIIVVQKRNLCAGIACGINLEYSFIPEMLESRGYKSYALGKWHLGWVRLLLTANTYLVWFLTPVFALEVTTTQVRLRPLEVCKTIVQTSRSLRRPIATCVCSGYSEYFGCVRVLWARS